MALEDKVNRKRNLQSEEYHVPPDVLEHTYENSRYSQGKSPQERAEDLTQLFHDKKGNPRTNLAAVQTILQQGRAKTVAEIIECLDVKAPRGYLPVAQIGRGGMFKVYEAIGPMKERWALKRIDGLRPELLQDAGITQKSLIERMNRNSAAGMASEYIARLNVLTASDAGNGPSGVYFIETLVEETLADTLKEPLEHKRAAAYTSQLAQALKDCHDHNIYHRDIKPDNIGIRNGKILLFDFSHSQNTLDQDKTRKEIGGLKYRAPEIYRHEQFLAQSDQYALGVVYYEMWAAKHPLHEYDPHLTVDFTPGAPRKRSSRRIEEIITSPDYLDRIMPRLEERIKPYNSMANVIRTMLNPDPNERYKDTDALYRVIMRTTNGLGVQTYG